MPRRSKRSRSVRQSGTDALLRGYEAMIAKAHAALDRAGAPVQELRMRPTDGATLTIRSQHTLSLSERIDALAERLDRHVKPVPRGGAHESELDEML